MADRVKVHRVHEGRRIAGYYAACTCGWTGWTRDRERYAKSDQTTHEGRMQDGECVTNNGIPVWWDSKRGRVIT